ncbi:hypothetical protein SAMN05216184_101639 [Georgenia satyanarayanai]|uniref:Uncharacterized protein n=1 Tax=Georgenia satyanarayanai TaxID=860221 RepID=A0A2Y8ZZF9_9MICO|nr:hypothetical protein [Georgenia satyanarayanai]PYG02169.1 hypothetical protein A8987_101639 [Georgenia satyanarayanai]SSA36986.1 hypothetical protein SAMN05216184_101639 [Georgenia satyanarayanai]
MAAVSRRHVLLRWGLPRDPRAGEHVLGFVLTTVVTIVATRGLLQLTGFPQVGGETLHVAHVLWGGLFMALAMVLALSFAGPVIRPLVAFLGGVGFGLFIDEVGKFLTQDNDYFFQPAPMVMYVTLVALVVLADVLHGRRPPHPSEQLAAAADHAVAGLAGGLSPQRREVARELLRQGSGGRGEKEVEALLAAVPDDHSELPDPLELATRKVRSLLRGVVRGSWTTAVAGALLVLALGGGVVVMLTADDGAPAWSLWAAAASSVLVVAVAARAWTLLGRDRYDAFQWMRRAFTLQLLVTVVGLYRLDPWPATAVMAIALLGLGVVQAEKVRLEQTGQGGVHQA